MFHLALKFSASVIFGYRWRSGLSQAKARYAQEVVYGALRKREEGDKKEGNVSFQARGSYALSASGLFALLNQYVTNFVRRAGQARWLAPRAKLGHGGLGQGGRDGRRCTNHVEPVRADLAGRRIISEEEPRDSCRGVVWRDRSAA